VATAYYNIFDIHFRTQNTSVNIVWIIELASANISAAYLQLDPF